MGFQKFVGRLRAHLGPDDTFKITLHADYIDRPDSAVGAALQLKSARICAPLGMLPMKLAPHRHILKSKRGIIVEGKESVGHTLITSVEREFRITGTHYADTYTTVRIGIGYLGKDALKTITVKRHEIIIADSDNSAEYVNRAGAYRRCRVT